MTVSRIIKKDYISEEDILFSTKIVATIKCSIIVIVITHSFIYLCKVIFNKII